MKKRVLIVLLSLPMVTFASGSINLNGPKGYLLPTGSMKINSLKFSPSNAGTNQVSLAGSLLTGLTLAAPNGKALRDGTYHGATKIPLPSSGSPVLILGIGDRVCNQITGDFDINSIKWQHSNSSLSTLQSLRATFHMNCDSEVIDGSVQYDA